MCRSFFFTLPGLLFLFFYIFLYICLWKEFIIGITIIERPWWSYVSVRLQIFLISCKVEMVQLSLIIVVLFTLLQFTLYFYSIFLFSLTSSCKRSVMTLKASYNCKLLWFLTFLRSSNFRFKANLAFVNCDKILIHV